MRKSAIWIFLLSLCCTQVYGQSSNRNYIIAQTYKTATTTRSGDVSVASQDVAYFDGLGRPLQNVSVFASPDISSNKPADLVTHTTHDEYGRVSQVSMPYPQANGNAGYQSGAQSAANSYYNNSSNFANPNDRGYSRTEYEASPLDRVTKQYAGGTDKAVEFSYGVNGGSDVRLYTVSGNSLQSPGHYGANQLSYVETKDENGNRSREYKDKLGRVVLQRVYTDKNNNNTNLDTYYVYDDLNRLRFVLQPKYQDDANVYNYFYYEYNDRGLMIKKGIPGAGITEMDYNDRDLISTSTDANGKITYYKYDALNRLTETGEKQGGAESAIARMYYDTYPGEVTGFKNDVGNGYPNSRRNNVKGLPTASAARILNPDGSYGSWYYTALYYNDRLQLIQTCRQLFDLGSNAVEYTTSSLRYDGRLEKQMISQQVATGTNSIEKTYTYDHADRVLAVKNTIKKESTVKLDIWHSATRYNGIGLVKNRYLHSANGTDYRQKLAHTFTPRSWLKKVEGQTGAGNNFGVELKYTDPAAGAAAQYNGNIAEMLWRRAGSWVGYKFSYDGVNRLLAAEGVSGNNYKEYDISYDKNGNINTLKRNDGSTAWDNLTYTYYQGRLNTVADATVSSNGVKVGTSVYQFDNAGNLTSDGNKSAGIDYNILNLPRQILVNSKTIAYHYDGAGAKVRINNGMANTKYAGIFEYNDNNYLSRIATDEGQIAVTSNGNTYAANYYLKDHLGNVRAVINGDATILQEIEYFAFGLAIPRSGNDAVNKYQYNGKEKQPETNWLDYGARMYMPEIGRWGTVDPRADKYFEWSPYSYVLGNPIINLDPRGDTVRVYTETSGAGHAWLSVGEGKNMTVYSFGRYSGTNPEWHGVNTLSNGPGVLLRLKGEEASKYNQHKFDVTGADVFQVLDVTDEAVGAIMDQKFNSSSERPKRGEYKDNPNARVIGDYKLFSNNCATCVSDALNQSGSKATRQPPSKTGSLDGQRFVVPSSMQSFFHWQSSSILGNQAVRFQETIRPKKKEEE